MSAKVVKVYRGARAPESLTVTWVRDASDAGFDATTVASAELHVSDGSTSVRWPCDVLSSTPAQVVVKHVFDARGAETGKAGQYWVATIVTASSGERRRGVPFVLQVLEYPPEPG